MVPQLVRIRLLVEIQIQAGVLLVSATDSAWYNPADYAKVNPALCCDSNCYISQKATAPNDMAYRLHILCADLCKYKRSVKKPILNT